jgi:hypothetical protein
MLFRCHQISTVSCPLPCYHCLLHTVARTPQRQHSGKAKLPSGSNKLFSLNVNANAFFHYSHHAAPPARPRTPHAYGSGLARRRPLPRALRLAASGERRTPPAFPSHPLPPPGATRSRHRRRRRIAIRIHLPPCPGERRPRTLFTASTASAGPAFRCLSLPRLPAASHNITKSV